MVLTKRTKKKATPAARAEAMGYRAGRDLVELGLPSRCPFLRPDLAAAWRRGYLSALD